MSGLYGWLGFAHTDQSHEALLNAMTMPGAHGLASLQAIRAQAALGAKEHVNLATLAEQSGAIALLVGRAYFASGERATAEWLLREFKTRGAACLGSIGGAFSLAIIDEPSGRAFLAVDRFAVRPLAYTVVDDCLIFGSSLDSIRAHPLTKAEINPQSVYNYAYFHMIPGPGTIYKRIFRIPAGHYVEFAGGEVAVKPYWEMRFEEHRTESFETLKQQFRSIIESSVARLAKDQQTGTFLSGGTDSSTVAGVLGRVTGQRARTYSIGFDAQGYDEMEYARIAAKHFNTDHHEYYVTPQDVLDSVSGLADVHDQPFGNSSAVPTFYCARQAKADGIELLLGGDGGDELFGGNTRYAKQRVFSLYETLPADLRRHLIEPLVRRTPVVSRVPVASKVWSYIQQASVPMPARMETYNLLERLGASNVFTADFLSLVDTDNPHKQLAATYNAAHAESLINRMLALDFKFTLTDNDLPKVTRSCGLAQMPVEFPLIDDPLVAFSASLAPSLKLKGLKLRYFFKEALRDFLPAEIITKKKHGFGLPVGEWLVSYAPLAALAREHLHDLGKRGVIRSEFIADITERRLSAHSGYYGTLVWVLLMLEAWLKARDVRFSL